MQKIFLKPSKNYIAIVTEDQIAYSNRRIGYIGANAENHCWLNAQYKLHEKLSQENIDWQIGNSNGGTSEKFKAKFNSIEDCINLLNRHFKVVILK